jgi:hypothetical protein
MNIWQNQYWCCCQLRFQCLKGLLACWGPLELNLLCQQGCHWPDNLGETFNEAPIITGHSDETLDSSDIFRCFPVQDSYYLFRIYSQSFSVYNVTQEQDFTDLELALAKLGIQLAIS